MKITIDLDGRKTKDKDIRDLAALLHIIGGSTARMVKPHLDNHNNFYNHSLSYHL